MKTVAQILKSKSADTVYQVRPTDSVLDALTLMAEARIGAVLVSDDDGKIVGIFTERDYARCLSHQWPDGPVLPVSELPDDPPKETGRKPNRKKAKEKKPLTEEELLDRAQAAGRKKKGGA